MEEATVAAITAAILLIRLETVPRKERQLATTVVVRVMSAVNAKMLLSQRPATSVVVKAI